MRPEALVLVTSLGSGIVGVMKNRAARPSE